MTRPSEWLTRQQLDQIAEMRARKVPVPWEAIGRKFGFYGPKRVNCLLVIARKHITGRRRRYLEERVAWVEALIAEHETSAITLTEMARREGISLQALCNAFTRAGYDAEMRREARRQSA